MRSSHKEQSLRQNTKRNNKANRRIQKELSSIKEGIFMTQKVHNTLRNFISSNNSFCDDLKKERIYIDDNILLELIIYYLRLNKSSLNILPEQDRYLINELINRHNFYISDIKALKSLSFHLSFVVFTIPFT